MLKNLIFLLSTNNKVEKIGEPLLRLWLDTFRDYDVKLIEKAVKAYIKSDESKYDQGRMPQIGLIFTHMRTIAFGSPEELAIDAASAWEYIMSLVRRGKFYIEDENLNKALNLIGGKTRLRMMTDSDEPFLRKEFIEKFIHIITKSQDLKNFSMESLEHERPELPEK